VWAGGGGRGSSSLAEVRHRRSVALRAT